MDKIPSRHTGHRNQFVSVVISVFVYMSVFYAVLYTQIIVFQQVTPVDLLLTLIAAQTLSIFTAFISYRVNYMMIHILAVIFKLSRYGIAFRTVVWSYINTIRSNYTKYTFETKMEKGFINEDQEELRLIISSKSKFCSVIIPWSALNTTDVSECEWVSSCSFSDRKPCEFCNSLGNEHTVVEFPISVLEDDTSVGQSKRICSECISDILVDVESYMSDHKGQIVANMV